jgi:predicted membrane channel-forming protein YqfA (hemolysin III family)
MKLSRERRASSPDACPGQINWDYDRAEIIADGAVHAIGVCLGLIGAVTIVVIAVRMERIEVTPILVYVIGLVTMLALSAAYNMWPVSPAKWTARSSPAHGPRLEYSSWKRPHRCRCGLLYLTRPSSHTA